MKNNFSTFLIATIALIALSATALAAPTVTINQPSAGDTINGTYSIQGVANDGVTNITKVDFYHSNDSGTTWTNFATLNNPSASWTQSWDTTNVSDGTYRLNATATNTTDATNTSITGDFTVDNDVTGPSIGNKSPTGTISSTSTTISATYSDPSSVNDSSATLLLDGSIVKTGGTSGSISYSTGTLSSGSHTVRLNVSDNDGNAATDTWSFTVPSASGNRIWDAADSPSLDYSWNYTSFSGFFYSFTDGLGTESMSIHLDSTSDRDIDEDDLVYSTSTVNVTFDNSGWGKYRVVGFLGEKYFAGFDSSLGNAPFNVDKSLLDSGRLSQVRMDTDEGENLFVGESLELEEGYNLRVVEIDLNGQKVWLELYKSGKQVESNIIDAGDTFTYTKDLGGVSDVPVIAVEVESVFRGTEASLVTLEGIFQISDNLRDVSSGESFGDMEVTSTSSTGLTMKNEDDFTLRQGRTIQVFGDVGFVVADSSTLRFAPVITTGGEREVRGTIASDDHTWTVNDFEGFFYDIDEDVGGEQLAATVTGERSIDNGDLQYTSNSQEIDFQNSGWGTFNVIGFMAEKYFAGYPANTTFSDANSVLSDGYLTKVLIDSDSDNTVVQGQSLTLKEGYALRVVQVDTDGNKAMMELYKDGEKIDGSTDIVDSGDTYLYQKDIEGVEDLVLVAAHIDSVFRGGESSVLILDGIFQISEDFRDVSDGSTFGEMEVTSTDSTSITMENDGSIQLRAGSKVSLMGNMSFRVADTTTLNYAPLATVTGEVVTPGEPSGEEPADKSLNVTASPSKARVGSVVEITATSNGSAVEGLSVRINADPVGQTDGSGRVLFTPNTAGEFTVTVTGEGYVEGSTTFTASQTGIFVEKPSRIVEGEEFTLRFTDEDENPLQDVSVNLDGEPIGTTDADGELTHTIDEAGVYSLSAQRDGLETLVTDLRVFAPAEIEIVDVVSRDIRADEEATFDVIVRNPGGTRFNGTLTMSVDGQKVDTRVVSLGPGEVSRVEFSHTFGSNILGSPSSTSPTVSIDGREVQVSVQPNTTKRAGVVGGIIILVAAGIIAYLMYFGPETARVRLDEVRDRAKNGVSQVREKIQSARGGEEETEEPFLGPEER